MATERHLAFAMERCNIGLTAKVKINTEEHYTPIGNARRHILQWISLMHLPAKYALHGELHTNTPLQALVTLNDSFYIDASRHFAYRMIEKSGIKDPAKAIHMAMRLHCTNLLVNPNLIALEKLYNKAYTYIL